MTRREGYSHPPLPSRVLLPLAFPVTPKPRGVSSGSPWFAATRGALSPSSLWEASWCVTFFLHTCYMPGAGPGRLCVAANSALLAQMRRLS